MRNFILLVSLLACTSMYAQYTQIPDAGFEQKLINMGIDSEGILDGRILTSDIENIEELDFFQGGRNHMIYSLDGLEGFTSLKELTIFNLHLYFDELDLSMLPQLEILYSVVESGQHDGNLSRFILTNNPNLEAVGVFYDWNAESINLKGSDLGLDKLRIEYIPGDGKFAEYSTTNSTDNEKSLCIEVTDPTAATNRTGSYENWSTWGNIFFTTNCTLDVEDYELTAFKVYPNPSQDFFQVDAPLGITKLILYDISGKEIKIYNEVQDIYDISDLSSGIYTLKIKFETGDVLIRKIIKD